MKRKVDNNLILYLLKILDEKNITYFIEQEDNNTILTSTISDEEYEIFEEDAMCLEQQGDKRTPVVSFRSFLDNTKRPKGPYRTLKRDKAKFEEYFENI